VGACRVAQDGRKDVAWHRMKLRNSGVLPFALILLAFDAHAAPQIDFQGLNGGTTRQEVLRRFPRAKPNRSMCIGSATTTNSAEGPFSCVSLEIDPYRIGQYSYDLSFLFSVDDKLTHVVISRSFGFPFGPLNTELTKTQLNQQYDELYQLLEYKYGDPLPTMAQICLEMDGSILYEKCTGWQDGNSQRWTAGRNHITLKLSAQRRTPTEVSYFGDFSVGYDLIDLTSAGKF